MLIRNSCLEEQWIFPSDGSVISVSATPNCSLIAATTVEKTLYLINSEGEEIWKKDGDILDNEGWSTAISADGSVVAVGTANKNPADGTVCIYNSRGDQIFTERLNSPVWSLSFSYNGQILAANCWNGKAYKFARQPLGYKLESVFESNAKSGLYGIKLSHDGTRAYLCAYDSAIIILDEEWRQIKRYEYDEGFYNISLAEDSGLAFIGLRQGAVLKLDTAGSRLETLKIDNCQRPICGISSSREGDLLVCGSFDGWTYLTDNTGAILSRLETNGEVWSVACSEDGSLICVGSADNSIRLLKNYCGISAIREIKYFESSCKGDVETEVILKRLVALYSQYGLYEYGYKKFKLLKSQQNTHDAFLFDEACDDLLHNGVKFPLTNYWAHYELGLIAQNKKRHHEAIRHFQNAARHPFYTSKAMMHCADSFMVKRLPAAAASCHRRAREQQIDNDAKRVLYNLGCSYEDTKHWAGAISHFQLLASWDIAYRNTWERLENLHSVYGDSYIESNVTTADYTEMNASLLGPDVPRDVDENLENVLQARTAEILVKPRERENVSQIIQKLRSNVHFCRGITGTGLNYDQELFLKYDFALPEDETKKFLETVNLLYLLSDFDPTTTLDIGSATGRYPMLMNWLGSKSYGIDIESRAIEYARKQVNDRQFPKYIQGDAQRLPFKGSQFDLVTCMMGTFAHVPSESQQDVVRQIFNVLRSEGYLAISTWDMDCSHLSYLSIYNERQKDTIRKNSPDSTRMFEMLENAGFKQIQIRRFCLLPQVVIYDLGLENLRFVDIELAAQADLAMRALYPNRHGEMFIAFGKK